MWFTRSLPVLWLAWSLSAGQSHLFNCPLRLDMQLCKCLHSTTLCSKVVRSIKWLTDAKHLYTLSRPNSAKLHGWWLIKTQSISGLHLSVLCSVGKMLHVFGTSSCMWLHTQVLYASHSQPLTPPVFANTEILGHQRPGNNARLARQANQKLKQGLGTKANNT